MQDRYTKYVVVSPGKEPGCIPVLPLTYLEGVQNPAIVVYHHRVSLLTLEALGTLRQRKSENFRVEPRWPHVYLSPGPQDPSPHKGKSVCRVLTQLKPDGIPVSTSSRIYVATGTPVS